MLEDLRQDQDLEELLQRSKTQPVLIFKHSTQCAVSTQAYEDFTDFMEDARQLSCGVVLVIENRELSDTIAKRLGIRHQSPQVLLIKDERVVWHASHWSITSDSLNDALSSYAQSPHQRN